VVGAKDRIKILKTSPFQVVHQRSVRKAAFSRMRRFRC